MKFLVMIIAFGLLKIRKSLAYFHNDNWFFMFKDWLDTRLTQSPHKEFNSLFICLLTPVTIISLILWGIGNWMFGLPSMAFQTLVLLYAFGRGDTKEEVNKYLEYWNSGNQQGAFQYAQDIFSYAIIQCAEDSKSLHQGFRQALLYTSFERLFAVLFWFLLLGVPGALLYRLVRLTMVAQQEYELIGKIVYVLEWLPVRILGFSFSLAGDFVNCFKEFKEHVFKEKLGSQQVLDRYGLSAVGLEETLSEDLDISNGEQLDRFISEAAREICAIQALLQRSLILWISVVAVISIIP